MNTIKCISAVSVDKGLVRNNNEDNFYFNGTYLYAEERDNSATFSSNPSSKMQLYGVFDGMGGEALGEEASLITAQVICNTHEKLQASECDIVKEILAAVQTANSKICKKIVESGEKRIGATFSALAIENDKAIVFNVGDSRVYLLRDGKLKQISVDDTTAQRMVSMGMITHEEAKTHKDRHKLTQHLGIFKDEMIIEPHVSQEIEIKKDDKFLLCSDGLTDMLTDEEIYAILKENKAPEELSRALVKAALKNGGKDNVTVMVVKAQTDKAKPVFNAKKLWPLAVVLVVAVAGALAFFPGAQETATPSENAIATPAATTVTELYFSNPVTELKAGTEDVFMVGVEPAGLKADIRYSSSNPDVLSIDEKAGVYQALSAGEVTVKAEADGCFCEMTISVYVPVEDIANIPEEISLKVGKSQKIQYKLLPEGVEETVIFASENEAVATVSEDGVVSAHAAGKTTVTISARDYSETLDVIVTEEVKQTEKTTEKKDDVKNKDNNQEEKKVEEEKTTPTPETVVSTDSTIDSTTEPPAVENQPANPEDSEREVMHDEKI